MSSNKHLFKERITITDYEKLIAELSSAISSGTDALTELLFGTKTPDLYENHGSYNGTQHRKCKAFKPNEKGLTPFTEKRLCKCMYYFNGPKADNSICAKCTFTDRFKIAGNYRITDYEVPAYYYGAGIGEIDLIIENGEDIYAAEVKPYKGNTETLLRMIAEIMTYTMGNRKGYRKAIAFFEKNRETGEITAQQKEWDMQNQELLDLIKLAAITVFQFKEVGNMEYEICRL